MVYTVKYSDLAKFDLDEIQAYISIQLASPLSAMRIATKINKYIASLVETPGIGHLSPFPPFRRKKIRHLNIDNYIALYTVDNKNGSVNILRIIYGGHDFRNVSL